MKGQPPYKQKLCPLMYDFKELEFYLLCYDCQDRAYEDELHDYPKGRPMVFSILPEDREEIIEEYINRIAVKKKL